MADAKSKLSLPSPTYKIESTGHELRMSYGMFSDINRLVGDMQNASALLIADAGTRDLVLRRLFTDNNKAVTDFSELKDSFEIELLPSEIDGVMVWVVEHIAHFLVSTGRKMDSLMEKYKDEMPKQEANDQSSTPSNDGMTA